MQKKSKSNLIRKGCLTIVTLLLIAILITACHVENQDENAPTPPTSNDDAFGEWIVEKDATCLETGKRYRTNKKGERQEEVIPAKGHDYGSWRVVTQATESQEGLKEQVCSRCSDKISKKVSALVDGTNGLEFTYWESQDMYYITGAGDAVDVKDLTIPTKYLGKTVIYVYKDSLNDMPNLETVKFADNCNITYIYPNAFKGCKKLKTIDIPASVTYLPYTFATDCDSLTQINVASDNENFCSADGVVYTKDMTSLVAFPQAKTGAYTLPDTLTSVTYKDIFKTTNYPLSTAVGVTKFETGQNENFSTDARGALYSKDMKKLVAYPIANTEDEYLIDSEVLNTVDAYAFANNKYLNSVKIVNGSGYKKIAGYAFYDTSIKTLEFEGIYTCETYAIFGNSELQNLIFNSGNTSNCGLRDYCIISNPSLKKVVLPYVLDEDLANKTLCVNDPFWNCTSLEEIAIEQGGECAYTSKDGAIYTKDMSILMFIPHARKTLNLPATLKAINTTAFKDNKSLSFERVDGLKYYQNWLIDVEDDEITSISVKEGTVGLGAKAISGYTLEKLSLPESLKYLSNGSLLKTKPAEFTYYSNFEYICTNALSQFGYVGGVFDLGTPSFVGDYALAYTKFEEIRVGFKNNGNLTVIEGSSMGGAFINAQTKTVMFGPYVGEIGEHACNKMNYLLDVYIASQYICDDELNFYNTWRTHYKSITKNKWIASNLTLSEDIIDILTGRMSNFHLAEGATVTIDGITYNKWARP